MPSLAILICTYKRPEKILRHLSIFSRPEWSSLPIKPHIYIYDDDPTSQLSLYLEEYLSQLHSFTLTYRLRSHNYGQGVNFLYAVTDVTEEYIWTIADDDYLLPNEAISFIMSTLNLKPSVSISQFQQGYNASGGSTGFVGENRLITSIPEALQLITNIGKGSSAIFRNQSEHTNQLIQQNFRGCMYEDRPFQVFSLLLDPQPILYLHTGLVVCGDDDYGCLNYSTRVFTNLIPVINYAVNLCSSIRNEKFASLNMKERSELSFWYDGVIQTLRRSSVRYTLRLLFSEIIQLPSVLLRSILKGKKRYWIR